MNEKILAWTTHRDREREGRKDRNYRKCNKKDKRVDLRRHSDISENIGEGQLRIAPKVIKHSNLMAENILQAPGKEEHIKENPHLCSKAP